MAIKKNVEKLVKIDDAIKEDVKSEIEVINEINAELADGLKRLKDMIALTRFKELTRYNAEEILGSSKEAISAFISKINLLERLNGRFSRAKEHARVLRNRLATIRDTLNVYNSAEKAVIDFENDIMYEFEVTVKRDFEENIEFNKRIEKDLG